MRDAAQAPKEVDPSTVVTESLGTMTAVELQHVFVGAISHSLRRGLNPLRVSTGAALPSADSAAFSPDSVLDVAQAERRAADARDRANWLVRGLDAVACTSAVDLYGERRRQGGGDSE